MTNIDSLIAFFKKEPESAVRRGLKLPDENRCEWFDALSNYPELLADKLAQLGCDKCCVGCKLYCRDTNHGDKSCADTIEEWLRQEAPTWPWEG